MTAVCLEAYLHWLAGWPSIAEIAKSSAEQLNNNNKIIFHLENYFHPTQNIKIEYGIFINEILGSIVVSIPACHAGDPVINFCSTINIGHILGSMVLVTRGEITAKENKLKNPITPLSKKGGDGGGTAIPFPINLGNCSIIGS
ncbi:hypothetical protein T01_8049 [Trichinella spiralis]|uniref:Uncharacterized protein n=1 Tax=Trichinella spiralis TaxID=6334 RepID=A0A0V1BN49_TRISP|nr:hypothetical protein T01_8049 [Trichinella spiralis]